MKRLLFITLLLCSITMIKALELPSIFADNMVLQQQTTVSFWGTAESKSEVQIIANWGEKLTLYSNEKGEWLGKINTPEAGGPYNIAIKSDGQTIELKNVLIGEVWLCSGQSNMEMPLSGWPPNDTIMFSDETIRQADYPMIRFFTVTRAISAMPINQCNGSWKVCTPETAASFSATAYFFGRKIHQDLKVPVGLIHSSWGGTPVESWMSQEKLRQFEEFRSMFDSLENNQSKINELYDWLEQQPVIEMDYDQEKPFSELDFGDKNIPTQSFSDEGWPTMNLPTVWEETSLGSYDGAIWFRKSIQIPSDWEGKELMLELGPIDDMDATYWNGNKIGSFEEEGFYNKNRQYTVPADKVQNGKNLVAVRVIDNRGGGGLYGDPTQLKVYPVDHVEKALSLAGEWNYLPVAEFKNDKFYVFDAEKKEFLDRPKIPIDISSQTPSFLYNAMIHPVLPYTIKGAIWYQGESNTGNPEQYDYLFPGLINDWRDKWELGDFPFYYVQIAPYDYGKETRSYRLREAQLKTMEKVDNTGMVVTLDIGNPNNIHPANKKDVGERLARWALAKNYNQDISYSGPVYNGMEVEGSSIILSFKYTENGLSTPDDQLRNFIIAGNDKNFYPAQAEIKGDRIIVTSPKVDNPVAVRYLWDNTSEASLFNEAGLPASSFRTDNW